MIKAAFDIVPAERDTADWNNSMLLLEVGEKFLGCVWVSHEDKKFLGLRQYHIEDIGGKPAMEIMNDIINGDELLEQHSNNTVVIYNFSESNLVPDALFHPDMNKPLMDMVFGNAQKGLILSEKIDNWNVYNLYRIPRDVHRMLQQRFSAHKYWHYYSLQMASFEKGNETVKTVLRVVFYVDKFVVAAIKDNELSLVQTYSYHTPEDVCYYLLSICRITETEQEDVLVKISGLVDEESILYTELLKYFTKIEWDGLPQQTDIDHLLNEFPAHYFSPLLRMAACV